MVVGERRERGDLRSEVEDERDRAVRADRVVAHDLERALAGRGAERVCRVGQRVEVQHAGEHGAGCEAEHRGEWCGQRLREPLRDAADHRPDPGADERKERAAPGDVRPVELDEAPDRDARQERDCGREPACLSGPNR